MTETKKKKSLWGVGIVVLYSSFVIFILSFVIFSTTQNFTLVEDNYYQKSLSYQDKIDMIQNTEDLVIKPNLQLDKENNILTISFTDSLAKLGIAGTAHFFRPSDKHADQTIPISLDSSNQMTISTTRFLKGLWVLKLQWASSNISYFQEENLTF